MRERERERERGERKGGRQSPTVRHLSFYSGVSTAPVKGVDTQNAYKFTLCQLSTDNTPDMCTQCIDGQSKGEACPSATSVRSLRCHAPHTATTVLAHSVRPQGRLPWIILGITDRCKNPKCRLAHLRGRPMAAAAARLVRRPQALHRELRPSRRHIGVLVAPHTKHS